MKKFLIIGTLNVIAYKDVFPSIMQGNIWAVAHFNKSMYFEVPDNFVYSEKYKSDRERNGKKVCLVVGCGWFTNIGENSRKPLNLTEHYNPEKYPKYDNYDAIEVSKVKDIPMGYYGTMGVPVTFLDKYNPSQFVILGVFNDFRCIYPGAIYGEPVYLNAKDHSWMGPVVNGKAKYKRLLIKRKK